MIVVMEANCFSKGGVSTDEVTFSFEIISDVRVIAARLWTESKDFFILRNGPLDIIRMIECDRQTIVIPRGVWLQTYCSSIFEDSASKVESCTKSVAQEKMKFRVFWF